MMVARRTPGGRRPQTFTIATGSSRQQIRPCSLCPDCDRFLRCSQISRCAKANANDIDFGSKVRCVGGMTAVPETTDYDTIAGRYSAKIDDRPWNALYERPTTLALLPAVSNIDVLDAGCGHGWCAGWVV